MSPTARSDLARNEQLQIISSSYMINQFPAWVIHELGAKIAKSCVKRPKVALDNVALRIVYILKDASCITQAPVPVVLQ